MSGAEASFVVGLISGVISIVEATKRVYDAAKDAKGQPEAFRQVVARLPLVIDILRSVETRAQELDEQVEEALEHILKSCKAKAEKLQEIFQKVVRKDDDKWYDRYKKAVATVGKGAKVENLLGEILKDIQVIACEKLEGTATGAQVKELEQAIKEMNEMSHSLQEQTGGVTQHHYGSGNNNVNTGEGFQHTGTGDIITVRGDAHFGSKK
jgi:N-terminal domain on NACHT_NTPase and P-loop NTPases